MNRSALLLLSLGLCACSGGERTIADYEGEPAYPSQRGSYRADGRLLGFVANRMSDSISVVDLDSMTLLGSEPIGRDPVDVDGPRHVLLDAGRRIGYVALSYPLAVQSVHVAVETGVVVKSGYVQAFSLDDLRPLGEQRVEASPSELALSSDGALLAVSHYDTLRSIANKDLDKRRASLALIDPADGVTSSGATTRLVPLCVVPASVVLSADKTRAFVACTGEDSLAVVDTVAGGVLGSVKAGDLAVNKPYAMVADPTGTRLAVSNQVAGTVVLFSATDAPALLSTTRVNLGVPYFVGWLSNDMLAAPIQEPSSVALIDAATGTLTKEVAYADSDCLNPSEIQRTASGRVFMVCEGNHFAPGAIVELDPLSLAVTARVEVELWPDRLAILEP